MRNRTLLYTLIPFIIFILLSINISYNDMRPVDGPVTLGYPLKFYEDNSDGRFCSANNSQLDICKPQINYLNLFINIVLIYIISLVLTYLFLKFRKLKL